MTELIFRDDAYLKSVDAIVQSINERGGIVLDKTNFYAAAGCRSPATRARLPSMGNLLRSPPLSMTR